MQREAPQTTLAPRHELQPEVRPAPPEMPQPGVPSMPRWNVAELVEPPVFRWRNWFSMIGPGLMMGAAAIGGGEWLLGPVVTAKYGAAMLWLATLSILGQTLYNIEICRYTLYSGEPIFTGKFRTLPGPLFWLTIYLFLDFGSFFPYLAANAATPAAALLLGEMPDPERDRTLLRVLAYVIFLTGMIPLLFGGKIYHSLKAVMTFKLVTVFSFLIVLAIGYSTRDTWREIATGFFKFGTLPVQNAIDHNGNGRVDPGEDLDNVFVAWWQGRELGPINFSLVATLCALAAIAGNGGLTNAPISNFIRDQGWGMGYHVGAIPSAFGGQHIQLSHVGAVFVVTPEILPRWRRWYRHVMRDQLWLWMPACFVGLALPSMLSVQFLERGTETDNWTAAGMTAAGVEAHVNSVSGAPWGTVFWYLTLLCGFLVLAPSMASTADGVIRRWIDTFWTASRRLQAWDPRHIRRLYFTVLGAFVTLGCILLAFNNPTGLIKFATMLYNYALGFSCLHALGVNLILLPKPLRPGWFVRIGMVLAAVFFLSLAIITTIHALR